MSVIFFIKFQSLKEENFFYSFLPMALKVLQDSWFQGLKRKNSTELSYVLHNGLLKNSKAQNVCKYDDKSELNRKIALRGS